MIAKVRIVYHITAFSWYAFIIKSLAAKDGEKLPPGIFEYGGPWKYLTFLNLLLQMVFFGMAVVNDLQTGKNTVKGLNKWKDLIFSVLAFPVGMFVVLLFWVIFSYDRQLVYPESLDAFFPLWMNHAMHTVVMPILLGEILLQHHVYPKTKNGLAALGVVGLAYMGWVIFIYLAVGLWVYPLLGLLNTSGVLGLFLLNMTVVTIMYLLGRTLNYCVWGKGKTVTKNK
ncbi:androgen-dependent TFPI-regulating protein [Salmo trutta]|uniref:Androgen-dependent TFPI-regulating protein-like n=1 Tax=Salmo trutta TaxID=8032 RepID=A0A674AQM8_SALTR|nr:androgen-dependent TFPI-regulating protein-like [Salmo trutta]